MKLSLPKHLTDLIDKRIVNIYFLILVWQRTISKVLSPVDVVCHVEKLF